MVLPWAIFLLGLRPVVARNLLLVYNVLECHPTVFALSLLVDGAGAILGCFIKNCRLLLHRKDTERHGCAVKFRARPLR